MKNVSELQRDRDQLQALNVHLLLQQGWESLKRALEIVDSFVEKTKGNPDEPWYLPMRLQRLQLCAAMEKGRSERKVCEKNFTADPNVITLQIYFEMLLILQDYEKVLSIQDRFDILWTAFQLYKEKNQEDKLAEAKKELAIILPEISYDDYFVDQVKKELLSMKP